MTDGDEDDPATDFDQATPAEQARMLEQWEVKYRRFTEFHEEQHGRKLGGDILLGWRKCYVELKPVKYTSGVLRVDGRDDDEWSPWYDEEPTEEEEEKQHAALSRVSTEDLESVEIEYRRITTQFEERTGQKLEGDTLRGWRMCYVELRPVKIHQDGHIEF